MAGPSVSVSSWASPLSLSLPSRPPSPPLKDPRGMVPKRTHNPLPALLSSVPPPPPFLSLSLTHKHTHNPPPQASSGLPWCSSRSRISVVLVDDERFTKQVRGCVGAWAAECVDVPAAV